MAGLQLTRRDVEMALEASITALCHALASLQEPTEENGAVRPGLENESPGRTAE
jgi:hypothetical protein